MSESTQWFIVKQDNGQCAIAADGAADKSEDSLAEAKIETEEQWGPFFLPIRSDRTASWANSSRQMPTCLTRK